MPSNREAYFLALKTGLSKSLIDFVLQEINGYTYSELTQHLDDEVKDYQMFYDAIERYLDGEMIEYILNKSYFLSIPFYVDKNVLIPRQETEQLVMRTTQMINELFGNSKITIADVCTGSGCIGLTLKKQLNTATVYLSDISNEALNIAKKNSELLDLDVNLLFGDMLNPFIENKIKCDVIICNPPYIQDVSAIDKKTWAQEPHLALLANPDTFFYEKVLKDYQKITNKKYLLVFEIGENMEESLKPLIKKYCPDADYSFEKDIYGKTRFLFIEKDI